MESAAGLVLIPSAVIVFCVLLFSLIFRAEVRDWMRRTTKAGPVEFAPTPSQQQAAATAHRGSDKALVTAEPPDPSVALWHSDVEEAVRATNIANKDDLIAQLKSALAMTRRAVDFNIAARLIFGTQIAVLRNLTASADGLTLEDLRPIYNEHVTRLTAVKDDRAPDILQWIAFLVGQRLVLLREGRYRITEAGKVFLNFITSIGFDEAKSF